MLPNPPTQAHPAAISAWPLSYLLMMKDFRLTPYRPKNRFSPLLEPPNLPGGPNLSISMG